MKNALPPGRKPRLINGFSPWSAAVSKPAARSVFSLTTKCSGKRGLIDNLSPAQQIELAIPAGGKRLTLEVSGEGSYSGTIGWANAGFMLQSH